MKVLKYEPLWGYIVEEDRWIPSEWGIEKGSYITLIAEFVLGISSQNSE